MQTLFVAATVAAGALLPWLLPDAEAPDSAVLGLLCLLSLVAGLRCVKPRGYQAWFVPTDAFVLAGIVTVGGRLACLLALVGLLGTSLGMAGRLPLPRLAFNAGAVVVATVTAAAAYHSAPNQALAFVSAAACYFLVNTALVAGAVALDRSRGWLATWRVNFLPTLPGFALATVLGGALCGLAAWQPLWMLVLGLLPSVSGTVAETLTRPR